MRAEPGLDLPPRPADEAEWEELLLRFELGPRALRFALEDLRAVPVSVLEPLGWLVAMEIRTARALEAMRSGGTVPAKLGLSHVDPADPAAAARKRLQEYTAQRADNFGRLQRRGLEVWEWAADLEGGGRITAYQAVRGALQSDAEVLAAVRAAGREG